MLTDVLVLSVLAITVLMIFASFISHRRHLAFQLEAEEYDPRTEWNVARARNHYGIPCATIDCECYDQRHS